MFDFSFPADISPQERWAALGDAAEALCAGEPDGIANMANVAALIWEGLPRLNWAGFYRVAPALDGAGEELVLGPFQGRPACIRIPFGKGVCGAAAISRQAQRVADVNAFAGHIACDAASRSELVVAVVHQGRLLAVIDLDSPEPNRFEAADESGLVELARRIAPALAG